RSGRLSECAEPHALRYRGHARRIGRACEVDAKPPAGRAGARARAGPGRQRSVDGRGAGAEADHGLASIIRLKGVWVARRMRVKPAWLAISGRRASPACAPSAGPLYANECGTHSMVEKP